MRVPKPSMPSGRRVWMAIVFATIIVLGLVVLPTRNWVGQRSDIAEAEAELSELTRTNDELQARIDHLSDPDTVERQARELYGYVYPGEESYTVPPRGKIVVDLPKVWPFNRLQDPLDRVAQRRAVRIDAVAK